MGSMVQGGGSLGVNSGVDEGCAECVLGAEKSFSNRNLLSDFE